MEHHLIYDLICEDYALMNSYAEQTEWSSSLFKTLIIPYSKSSIYRILHNPSHYLLSPFSLDAILEASTTAYGGSFKALATFTQKPTLELLESEYPELLL